MKLVNFMNEVNIGSNTLRKSMIIVIDSAKGTKTNTY